MDPPNLLFVPTVLALPLGRHPVRARRGNDTAQGYGRPEVPLDGIGYITIPNLGCDRERRIVVDGSNGCGRKSSNLKNCLIVIGGFCNEAVDHARIGEGSFQSLTWWSGESE